MATATPSTTPNPNAMKFSLDVTLPVMVNATSPEAALGQPLAEALFAIDGVVGVFATADFVTVSKSPDADWDTITPAATEILRTQL
jgi:NFU1 iron-sulfur cluster scaffold homolog, mitochondrial